MKLKRVHFSVNLYTNYVKNVYKFSTHIIYMRKISVLIFSLYILSACSAPKIIIATSVTRNRAPMDYRDYGKAVNDADFAAALSLTGQEEEKKAIRALQCLYERDTNSAAALFQEMKNAQNNYTHSVVLPYCFHHAMFQQCAEWAEASGQERYASAANQYLQIPAGEITFTEGESTLPASFNYGGCPEIEVMINGKVKKMLVDTGCTHSVISEALASESQVTRVGVGLRVLDSNNKSEGTELGYVEELTLGKLSLTNHPILISKNLSLKFGGLTLYAVDGIIGWDILQKMCVKISWKNRYVRFSPSRKSADALRNLEALTHPFITLQDEQGVYYYFHFDTGAMRTELFDKSLGKIKQQAASAQKQISFGVHSVSAKRARKVKHQRFTLGDKCFSFGQLSCSPERMFSGFVELDGRVGMDMFRQGAIEFDYGSGRIVYMED